MSKKNPRARSPGMTMLGISLQEIRKEAIENAADKEGRTVTSYILNELDRASILSQAQLKISNLENEIAHLKSKVDASEKEISRQHETILAQTKALCDAIPNIQSVQPAIGASRTSPSSSDRRNLSYHEPAPRGKYL